MKKFLLKQDIQVSSSILHTEVSFLKGIGPKKAELLKTELGICNYGDLIFHFPYKYVDKSVFTTISDAKKPTEAVQIIGKIRRMKVQGEGRTKRLVVELYDNTGELELVWFKGVKWMQESLLVGKAYIVYGKPTRFGNKYNIAHPEITPYDKAKRQNKSLDPLYPSTEKLRKGGLDNKGLRKAFVSLFEQLPKHFINEVLPAYLLEQHHFQKRSIALRDIHLPPHYTAAEEALNRFKFEELFYHQLNILLKKQSRKAIKGWGVSTVGDIFNTYYKEGIPFELTGAQKRVLREIRKDMGSGVQMNRLLQGDVGSGKTMVALMSMLLALDNGLQACMMAPTEILAQQHYIYFEEELSKYGVQVRLLTGSVKGKSRREILEGLRDGFVQIIIGTHALIEDTVAFQRLGIAVIDEQHRFGVAQRAKLWSKNNSIAPHILVMSATPIPRTLALTSYGDLDLSVIDELPPGRKAITTVHKYEKSRLWIFGFMRKQIAEGRQVYIVFPLIEESAKLDLHNLTEGYESVVREFPKPQYQVSVVHGKMKPEEKDSEMQRFVRGETQIMVATTVIEVGVNVPNASVMIIENAERFGLSQLHQLRGRVGRGASQSFCILVSSYKLSANGKKRIETLCESNDGFYVAEVDYQLRGGGDIDGTQQSGAASLHFADLLEDGHLLDLARASVKEILEKDPKIEDERHAMLQKQLAQFQKGKISWRQIS